MMAIGPGATLHGPSGQSTHLNVSSNDLVPAQSRGGGIRLSTNLFAQNPPKPKSITEVKVEAFTEKLDNFPKSDLDIFKPHTKKWYDELNEEFLEADDELMEYFCDMLCEQDRLNVTPEQKQVLRILVNLMFLKKFSNCPDNP